MDEIWRLRRGLTATRFFAWDQFPISAVAFVVAHSGQLRWVGDFDHAQPIVARYDAADQGVVFLAALHAGLLENRIWLN